MKRSSDQRTEEFPSSQFRMPAEWEPHEATWIAWPHNRDDWPGKFDPIPWVFAEIVRYLSRFERVELIVNDRSSEKRARKTLSLANALNENIRFHHWPTDRVWTRDSGCTFIIKAASEEPSTSSKIKQQENSLSAVKWRFNAWAKYRNFLKDDEIGSRMAEATRAHESRPVHGKQHVVLEGGSIDVNGAGLLLTTEECLLSRTQQRNPGVTRKQYESIFARYLGIADTIWLKAGIAGDDTHGHVDDITRFVARDTVVTAVEPNPSDVNYEPLRENIKRLRAATGGDGKSLAIVELPLPAPIIFDGRRLPASYANFYIANGIVLVPVFNDPNDRVALDIMSDLFPDREVVGIYCGDLIWGFGAIHCMTQQQPAVVANIPKPT